MPSLPVVVKFAFGKYSVQDGKHRAECNLCKKTIREKMGTTSGFVRHLKRHHKLLFDQYAQLKQKALEEKKQSSHMNVFDSTQVDIESLVESHDIEEVESFINNSRQPPAFGQMIPTRKAENRKEKAVISIADYFRPKSSPVSSLIIPDDEDDLFGKMLTAEIRKISDQSLKRKLKRQLLEVVHSIQEEYEATFLQQSRCTQVIHKSDNWSSQTMPTNIMVDNQDLVE